jgi:hypothetical protein
MRGVDGVVIGFGLGFRGAASLLSLAPLRVVMGAVGAVVLAWLGLRTLLAAALAWRTATDA